MIAELVGRGDDSGLVSVAGGAGGETADRRLVERRGHVHALKVEGRDLLLLAVLVDFEVALLQIFHQLAGLRIARYHVGEHEIGVGLERETALRGCVTCAACG